MNPSYQGRVLLNEARNGKKIKLDTLKSWTYALAHAYPKATRAVRTVSLSYIAKLVAERKRAAWRGTSSLDARRGANRRPDHVQLEAVRGQALDARDPDPVPREPGGPAPPRYLLSEPLPLS